MLHLVQGDVLEFCIAMCNVDPFAVKQVHFISKDLGVEVEAYWDNGVYRVRVQGEITQKFPVGFARYDVVVTLIDDEKVTVKLNEKMEVLKRNSEV